MVKGFLFGIVYHPMVTLLFQIIPVFYSCTDKYIHGYVNIQILVPVFKTDLWPHVQLKGKVFLIVEVL